MMMKNCGFIVPEQKLESNFILICGNFIAEKHSGHNNGNKTSWHVSHVEWIIGNFESHQYDEVDLGTQVMKSEGYETGFVTTNLRPNSGSTCYIKRENLGKMNKAAAKKYIQEKHKNLGFVVAWSSLDNKEPVKHSLNQ